MSLSRSETLAGALLHRSGDMFIGGICLLDEDVTPIHLTDLEIAERERTPQERGEALLKLTESSDSEN